MIDLPDISHKMLRDFRFVFLAQRTPEALQGKLPLKACCEIESSHWLEVSLGFFYGDESKLLGIFQFHATRPLLADDYRQLAKDAILGFCDAIIGLPCDYFSTATYSISVADLADQGIIKPFLGFDLTASGLRLSLTGASMTVENEDIKNIEWKIGDDVAEVIIDKAGTEDFSESLMADSEKHLRNVITRLVLRAEGMAS